jgi:hypothetical protein
MPAYWFMDQVTSPCIDVGNPDTYAGDEPLPNGNIINIAMSLCGVAIVVAEDG